MQIYRNLTIPSPCIKEPAYLTKCSLRLDWMTLRGTTVIMTDVNSDQVKQSTDNLEKYRPFTKGKLSVQNEFDQCGSLFCKIMLDREMYHLLT